MNKLPLLPTTVVGSHAKPSWWHQCKGLIDTGEWGSQDLSELLDDAVDIAIQKAGDRAAGSILSSDAFFPFPDAFRRPVFFLKDA